MAKKAVFWLVIGFAIFYIWSQPEVAAKAVRGVFDFVVEVFRSLIRFFTALAR